MIAKEWRDARWKLVLGVLAFLVLVPAIRSYEAIRDDVRFQVEMMQRDLREPERRIGAPMNEREREAYLADVREMQRPEYIEEMARWELRDTSTFRNLLVIVPLAGLFGVGLIAGEVGRGSVFLLLSRPVSRTRILVTKYSVCAACLFVVAAIGGASIVLVAYARGYTPETGLTYLGRCSSSGSRRWRL